MSSYFITRVKKVTKWSPDHLVLVSDKPLASCVCLFFFYVTNSTRACTRV